VFDPEAMYNSKKALGEVSIKYCLDKYEAVEGTDALIILTEWKEFSTIDLERIKGSLRSSVIFDGRNILDRKKVEESGFTYFAIGKRTSGTELLSKRPTGTPGVILKNGD
jgi:UDPglucose 6-dehydrogenase